MLGLIVPCAANATVSSIHVALQDRGFGNGIQLRYRESGAVFFRLPTSANVSNLRLHLQAQITAPNLFRGSLLVTANGQPVGAVQLAQNDGVRSFEKNLEIDRHLIAQDGSINLRFEAELLANSDPCANDFDPANVVSILPATTLTYDVDLNTVQTLTDALRLLPHNAQILVSPNENISPALGTTALQLSTLMIEHGINPAIETRRNDSPVTILLKHGSEPTVGEIATLERSDEKLNIAINTGGDVTALTHLWQLAPATITGGQATASRSAINERDDHTDFREFTSLALAKSIRQTAEWVLPFSLLADDGRFTKRAKIKFALAPDWSDESPIATIYLNGQLISAARLNPGDNEIRFSLPIPVLDFHNNLRVVVKRSGEKRYCTPAFNDQTIQILPGSGVFFGNETGYGFAQVARQLAKGGILALPAEASQPPIAIRYLNFASKVIAAFGLNADDIDVAIGSDKKAPNTPKATFSFETTGVQGLQIPFTSRAERIDLKALSTPALVGLFSNADGTRLRAVLSHTNEIPDPATLYLSAASGNALIGPGGTVWRDQVVRTRSFLDDVQDSAVDLYQFIRRYGLSLIGAIAVLIVILITSRKLLVIYFRGKSK